MNGIFAINVVLPSGALWKRLSLTSCLLIVYDEMGLCGDMIAHTGPPESNENAI